MVRHKTKRIFWIDQEHKVSRTHLGAPHLCTTYRRTHTWQKKRGQDSWRVEAIRLSHRRGHKSVLPEDVEDSRSRTVTREWHEYALVLSEDWLEIRRKVKDCSSDQSAMTFIARVLMARWGTGYLEPERIRRLHKSARGRLPSRRLARMSIAEAKAGIVPTIRRARRTCKVCGEPLEKPKRGRAPTYCSQACIQSAYRARQKK